MSKAPTSADQKLVTESAVTAATMYSIRALMTRVNSPRVRMFTGSVRMRTRGRMNALTIPSTSAATMAAPKSGMRTP